MKIALCILFLFANGLLYSQQNLIYNGSFEEYYSCPTGNDLNDGQLEKVKGWWKPTFGTSDYFNSCNATVVGTPSNFWGYQPPFDGEGYVGLVLTEWTQDEGYFGYEYVQGNLISPLKQCQRYKYVMHVSMANASFYSMGRIGALFSQDTTGVNLTTSSRIQGEAQVYNKSLITDTTNWITVEGEFVAEGGEEFITIGYFFETIKDDTLYLQPSPFISTGAYFYIDSVSLFEKEFAPMECSEYQPDISNVFTPNDDLVNDFFSIEDYSLSKPRMQIFNRWGEQVAELDATKLNWDGKTNGDFCEEGVYFYCLQYFTAKGEEIKNGYIHLIRD